MAHWIRAPLGELTQKIGSGATPLGGEAAYRADGISLIRSLNVHDGEFRRKNLAFLSQEQADGLANVVVQSNDVLLNITGASIARCCTAPDDVLPARVNQHVAIIRPHADRITPQFLTYLLVSRVYKDRLLSTGESAGTTRQALTKAQLQSFVVEFPESLQEQARIVAILDEAFEGIATAKANAEKNLQNACELFAGHLQAVFSQRGDGWVTKTVQQWVDDGVLAKPQDGNHGEIHPTKADYVEVGVPFIMAADMIDGVVDTQGCRFIASEQASSLRIGFAKAGDVLLSHKGTIGRVAILDTSDDYVILTPQVTYYRSLDSTRLLIEFLYYCLLSPEFQAAMNRIAGAGSTRAYIGITRQLDLQLTLPPVSVQRDMAVRLRRIDEASNRLAKVYQAKQVALDELKRSLLHQAFTGALSATAADRQVAEVL